MCPGPAGTGKSYVIDALVTEIRDRYKEKHKSIDEESFDILICGPTGKAALNIGGHTINSSEGLCVPTEQLENLEKNRYKHGPALLRFQQRIKKVIAVIIDELSMISSRQLYWISRRLQEATGNFNMPFRGIPIIFFGDHGQLAPVGGTPMWMRMTSSGKKLQLIAAAGHSLYANFKTILYLTEVKRQTGIFRDILLRLRDGETTKDDWAILKKMCCSELMSKETRDSFETDQSISILSSNHACKKKNHIMLKQLGSKVCRVDAKHDSDNTKTFSAKFCQRIQTVLYLGVGAKVILLWNLSVKVGLVDGSVGTVIDFWYDIHQTAPALPAYIIINFPDYSGQPYFESNERRHWMPISPQTFSFTDGKGGSRYRKQFPIACSWALTAWKAQGMTCHGKVNIEIDSKEKSTGITYVQMSRCTRIENLCYHPGVSYERLSTGISNSKSLQLRKQEEIRLRQQWYSTRQFFNFTKDVKCYQKENRNDDTGSNIDVERRGNRKRRKVNFQPVAKKRKKECNNEDMTRKQQVNTSVEKNEQIWDGLTKTEKSNDEVKLRSIISYDQSYDVMLGRKLKNMLSPKLIRLQKQVEDDNRTALDNVVVTRFKDFSLRYHSFIRLRASQWLNDETIHYFCQLMKERDKSLSELARGRKRCHFFDSFFWSRLMDENNEDENLRYEYRFLNIRRWLLLVPGKNIFNLDKIFIPINIKNLHWILSVINMSERRVELYDSLYDSNLKEQSDTVKEISTEIKQTPTKKIFNNSFYIETIIQVLKDEWSSKHNGEELPNLDEWKNNSKVMTAPRQQNNYDCGVMVLMFTYFLSIGRNLSFMSDASKHGVCRWFITLSILDNTVHDIENL